MEFLSYLKWENLKIYIGKIENKKDNDVTANVA